MPRKIDSLIGSGFDKPHVDVNKESKEQAVSRVLFHPLTLCLQLRPLRGAGRAGVPPAPAPSPGAREKLVLEPRVLLPQLQQRERGQLTMLIVCHLVILCPVLPGRSHW